MNLQEKFYIATKNILLNNLKVNDNIFLNKDIIFVYDLDSKLSQELSKWYIKSLRELQNLNISRNIEKIDFNKFDKEELKNKLLNLKENSTVILVQSTNFMLDNFRIRLNLNNAWVWCLEHRHLAYIYDNQIENYADSIEYKTPYYQDLWFKLKKISDVANSMKFICNDWSILNVDWWFEDMKINDWNYDWKNRWGNFPIWENFTEAKKFDNVNGELSIYAFPDEKLKVEFVKPFKIKIEKSKIMWDESIYPETFKNILNFIKESEDWEVMFRELGFWLNNWITKDKPLSDINSYERIAWFHISLWKKHQIYRRKLDKSIVQRYHIDIFPDIKEIYIDEKLVFKNGNYII